MKITIKAGPANIETKERPVVIEVWMSLEEAKAHAHRSPALEEAIEDALPEHLKTRFRVSKAVHTGRHP